MPDPVQGLSEEPRRIQLSRAAGFRLQEASLQLNGLACVKVDRSTKWGNPFSVQAAIDYGFANDATGASFVVECFREWLSGGPRADAMWMGPESEAARRPFADLSVLRGKNLACWCKLPKPGEPDLCHAAVLLELANR